jgi:hypothetical protein
MIRREGHLYTISHLTKPPDIMALLGYRCQMGLSWI